MFDRKVEYRRMLHLAADEEAATTAAEARYDDRLLIEGHRSRAKYFRDLASRFAFKPQKTKPEIES